MNIKRKTVMALTGLSREQFDKCIRYDQLPFLVSPEEEVQAMLPEPLRTEGSGYSLRDALQIVVAQDLARSYWHTGTDLKAASRIVRTGWRQIVANIPRLDTDRRADEIWIGTIIRRGYPQAIAEEEIFGRNEKARELLEGLEPVLVNSLPQLMASAIEWDDDYEAEIARVVAANVNGALRLFKARAHRYAIQLPETLDWIA